MHLLGIITLIASAVSLGIIMFQGVNIYFPDIVSDPYFSRSGYLSTMRSALATFVVVFPVFLWTSWFIAKDIYKNPEKKELKIRKWLLYLTLFIAALVIIGDVVALMRNFLEGELSQRFIFKVFSILFIAGSVFLHYLSELREKKYKFIKTFDWSAVAVVAAIMVTGFFVAGTPQSQRLVRLDERRVSDLQNIQWQIINFWQRKEVLPADLNELVDPIGGFTVPLDPETGEQYEYSVTGELDFELCADFRTSSAESGIGATPELARPVKIIDGVWNHSSGRVCFERTIDPDLYPPVKLLKNNI